MTLSLSDVPGYVWRRAMHGSKSISREHNLSCLYLMNVPEVDRNPTEAAVALLNVVRNPTSIYIHITTSL